MVKTIGLAEAKARFSEVTTEVNRTGKPVTVLKNNRPWVAICPIDPTDENLAVDLLNPKDATATDMTNE